MIRKFLTALSVSATLVAATPAAAGAQTFQMQKFDIKGDGGTDYVTVESATGRVFVSRSTHVMVVEGASGKVVGDIPNTPGVHGAGIATKAGHGFTTNGGDQTVTMFDLKTLAVIKQIKVGPGLDGIMYDEPDDKIILTNHSRPVGTLVALDPKTGDIVATVNLEDTSPEGAAADGKGHIFVNNEGKNTMQVIDVTTWKATATWPLAPCEGPTGHRVRQGLEPPLLRVQQDFGCRRRQHRQSRGFASRTARASTRSAGIRRRSWSTFRTAAKATSRSSTRIRPGQVQRGRDRRHVRRREDHRGGSGDAQRLPVSARARSGSGAHRRARRPRRQHPEGAAAGRKGRSSPRGSSSSNSKWIAGLHWRVAWRRRAAHPKRT